MDFLRKIRDAIHGRSEETRKFFAMVTMGVLLLVFFSVWSSVTPSRLIALGPPDSGEIAEEHLSLTQPVAVLTPEFSPPQERQGPLQAQVTSERKPRDEMMTPVQGIAETLFGIQRLFARKTPSQGASLQESLQKGIISLQDGFHASRGSINDFGVSVGRGALRLYAASGSAAAETVEFLYRTISPYAAPSF